ncbi:MAG: NAD(P)H-binding protein [Paracoccaceae bacterium]
MKIFLLGASGMIGSRILAEAVSRGHEVVAGARHPEKIAAGKGVTAVKADLSDAATLARHAAAADVIVSAVSPRNGGDPVAEADAIGAAVMGAAQASGKRLAMVGGAGSLNLPDGSPLLPHVPEPYQAEARGFKQVYQALKASDLDWTFFAPAGTIAPGTRTGRFRLGQDVLISAADGTSSISAEDYAAAFVDELETPKNRRSIMTIGY